MDIKNAIKKVAAGRDLTEKEAYSVFTGIMTGEAAPGQIASFLTALHMKGEAIDEITGAAKVMREKAVKLKLSPARESIVDTCGTGGTGTDTFNISTAAAFVVAAAGVKVAKHGNRAASGGCGSADVLEELGVKLDVPAKLVARCIDTIGIGFLFAPLFHGAMRYAAAPRKEIGIRTIFNILGPLSNPAKAGAQVIGIFDGKLTESVARVLSKLGLQRGFVVHGDGPLDEVTISGRTRVSEVKKGKIRTYYVSPKDFGIKKASLKKVKGGTAKENAEMLRRVLEGEKGARRDIVIMNSAMALVAAGKAGNFKEGARLAEEAIDSGKALEKLDKLIKLTRKNSV